MSRRPAAGPDRSEQNRATLKQLVKLESNKSCADCKRNKHPRWASWNIGVFVCIRCSGIHRGMGTHISRVKSVDLDSWTDEQMQNMIRWGNGRANRYWEDKLAAGHVPNEAKIENFIRTKYDSKRWVMDGPMPDPSTLDDGSGATDDDVPLNVVREKAIERNGSLRNGSAGLAQPPRVRPQDVDLFGDAQDTPVVRPNTTEPPTQRPGPPKASAAPPKQMRPGESLLGLDFLGGTSAVPPTARPSSTGVSSSAAPGRADLKSSILSLYASKPVVAPQPQPQPQTQPQSNVDLFGGMSSPPLSSPAQQPANNQQSGGMTDAFSSLSFGAPHQSQVQLSTFSGLSSPTQQPRQLPATKPALSGGSFFDPKPAAPIKQQAPPTVVARQESFGGGDWGDFSSAAMSSSPPAASTKTGSLFDMSTTAPAPATASIAKAPAPIQAANYTSNNAFNLSSPASPKASTNISKAPNSIPAAPALASFSNADAWGSNDAWATPDPPTAQAAPVQAAKATPMQPTMQLPTDGGWDDSASNKTSAGGGFSVTQDEEFGAWGHASPVATSAPPAPKQSGGFGGGSDDLFGNVWG